MQIEIKPTRSELIKLKERIKLAKSGHSILKKRRDGLILELFEILKRVKSARSELAALYREAFAKVNLARTIEGDNALRSLSLLRYKGISISTEVRNILGVKVPKIIAPEIRNGLVEKGYGYVGLTLRVNEAVSAFEKLMEKAIVTAEIETAMKNLLREIEKAKRRVSALEVIVIPQLEKSKEWITTRLNEADRENTFRLKKIKKKSKNKENA